MSDFAAGDYLSQKFGEFTQREADAHWSTPHRESTSALGVARMIVVALARLI